MRTDSAIALADRVIEQLVEVRARGRTGFAVDLQDVLARLEPASAAGPSGDDRGDAQPAVRLVLGAIEVDGEPAERRLPALRRRRDAHVRRVQLAEHQRDDRGASRRACAHPATRGS